LYMDNSLSKAERTRQFIIETTAGIFNTKGYAGTSMSDITEATGLTKGSIYGNFENKEEVALAVFDHNYNKVSTDIRQRINQATTYHDKLMVYAKVYHSFTRGGFPKGGCPILNTAVEADDTNGPLKEKATNAVQRWKRGIMNLIQGGVDAGEFKPGVEQEQVALSIIALIEGGIMIAKITDTPANLDKVLKTVEMLISKMKV
jgi:TetR/AcrR family transcriptional repressor of nem operon